MRIKSLILILTMMFASLLFATDYIADGTLNQKVDDRPIVIYGDTRTNHDIHESVLESITKVNPKAVFHTGDMLRGGMGIEDQWNRFREITKAFRDKNEFYPVIGNHEHSTIEYYFETFDFLNEARWYSVDVNNIHFVIMDTNSDISIDSEQYNWLLQDLLSRSEEISFTVALFHHPPFTTGPHPDDEKGLRETIVPMLSQYNVNIVFSGHNHSYEKSMYGDIYYIVAAGGGAPLYEQIRQSNYSILYLMEFHFCKISIDNDGDLVVDVLNREQELIDQITIKARENH